MENKNVLKTALGVGVLGTAAVALGYYYFNEEKSQESESESESELENVSTVADSTLLDSITEDVIEEMKEKKTQMKSFWEQSYKTLTGSDNEESATKAE
uniref:Uncharacterized protein n=1 Tax=viral metagenome TaxID=1070528 RepID=A0A6C0C3P2_9ZZZZ